MAKTELIRHLNPNGELVVGERKQMVRALFQKESPLRLVMRGRLMCGEIASRLAMTGRFMQKFSSSPSAKAICWMMN